MYDKTILIVDDEPRTREGLKKTLDKGYEGALRILTASNGAETLEIIEEQRVHVLLTDIRMPEISGLELLKILKEKDRLPVTIVISAYPEFEYAQEALSLGVINYLLKPISKKKLMEAVEEAIKVYDKNTRTGIISKVVDEKLIEAYDKNNTSSSAIRDAMHYIDKHLDRELSQKEVAEHVHLNPSYLSVLFKEQVHLTFSEYVTRRRIQHAKELLISTNMPIAEIAEKSGYKTAKYFNKIFKDLEGVTPGKYRKNNSERAF